MTSGFDHLNHSIMSDKGNSKCEDDLTCHFENFSVMKNIKKINE